MNKRRSINIVISLLLVAALNFTSIGAVFAEEGIDPAATGASEAMESLDASAAPEAADSPAVPETTDPQETTDPPTVPETTDSQEKTTDVPETINPQETTDPSAEEDTADSAEGSEAETLALLEADLAVLSALTVEPGAETEYDGYIVKIKEGEVTDEMVTNAPSDLIAEELFVVETPQEVLDFAAPAAVEYIEPNYTLSLLDFPQTAPDDALFPDQWNLNDTYGIKAQGLWSNGLSGAGVRVAVIDSGVNGAHQDWASGAVLAGYSFWGSQNPPAGAANIPAGTNSDDLASGHGTVVASIIAAASNNGTNMAGIAYDTQIVPMDIFDNAGSANTIDCIEALTVVHALNADANTENDIGVVNMSLGTNETSSSFAAAVAKIIEQDVIVVAAVGNGWPSNAPVDFTCPLYPAAYAGVIGVASTSRSGAHSSFSQRNSSVDIAAPGESIFGLHNGANTTHRALSGTSVAAPHVAAMAAAARGYDPGLTSGEFLALLQNTASVASSDRGNSAYYGAGIADAQAFGEALTEYTEVLVGGKWFLQDGNGNRKDGWFTFPDGRIAYFDGANGRAQGVKTLGDDIYYFGPNGNRFTGEIQINGKWFKFGGDGKRLDGLQKNFAGLTVYYDGNNGVVIGRFLRVGNDTYYFHSNAEMAIGEIQINGRWFKFGGDGKRLDGLQKNFAGLTVYYDGNNGVVIGRFLRVGNDTYYFHSNAEMAIGEIQINSKWFKFGGDGKRLDGLQKNFAGQMVYYDGNNGVLRDQVRKIGNDAYYFQSNAVMFTGEIQINGKWFKFGADGKRLEGLQKNFAGQMVYYDGDNGVLIDQVRKIGSDTYYFQSNAVMFTGEIQINGRWFKFGVDGKRLEGLQKNAAGQMVYYDGDNGVYFGERVIDGKGYFFSRQTAVMRTGIVYDGQIKYTIGADGVIQSKEWMPQALKGIDVSGWNGVYKGQSINWQQVAASGVRFALVRAGWFEPTPKRDMFTTPTIFQYDRDYVRNVTEARRYGIAVGAYIYTYAYDNGYQTQGINEFHSFTRSNGLRFDLPVFIDVEDAIYYKPNTDARGGYGYRTSLLRNGLNQLRSLGYKPGLYSFLNWSLNEFDTQQLINEGNSFWLARWYGNDAELSSWTLSWNDGFPSVWQYRSTGSVPGISGAVDMNYLYPGIVEWAG